MFFIQEIKVCSLADDITIYSRSTYGEETLDELVCSHMLKTSHN